MSNYLKVPTQKAADLLSVKASHAGIPTIITMQVTDRCNYACAHCYQEHKNEDEMSTEEILDYLQQFADMGVLFLTLMGGEFFMRPDADEILAKAHDMGFALKVLSTGHHIHDKRADFLATLRPLQVDMSLYSASPNLHEQVTLQAGSWKRTYDAARRLIERKVTVLLKSPVMESNVNDLLELKKLSLEIGAQYTFDPNVTAIEDGDQSTVSLRMSEKSLKSFYTETMSGFMDKHFGGKHDKDLRPLDATPCRAGQVSCFVTPRGEVFPCGSLPITVGNLRKQSFRSIWDGSDSLDEIRNKRWATIPECNRCPVRNFCSRCHGMALIEQGTMNGPSLEACRHAVAVRDSLRERGQIPETHTELPPTWDRVEVNGQHHTIGTSSGGRRSPVLRVLP